VPVASLLPPTRFIRVCPEHRFPLRERVEEIRGCSIDILTCPGPPRPAHTNGRPLGSHRVETWATLDLARNVVYGIGTRNNIFVIGGELDDILCGWHDLVDMKRQRGRAKSTFAQWRSIPESPEGS
jgi:hypothetical protein